MKRSREEGYMGPQVKRPTTSCGEPSGGPQHSRGPQKLTTDDALAYLKAVKDMFKDRKEKYDEFLEVMKEFKAQRIDTAGVIERVKDLFKGHRDLILGFNTFLPKGYEITLSPEEELSHRKQPVEFDQAINYVNKIKTRFQDDEHVYKAFLEILNLYRRGNKSIGQVYDEVASLFKDHPDLLEEFTHFLPDNSGAHVLHPPPLANRSVPPPPVRREERTPVLSLKQLEKKERPASQYDWDHDRDQSAERPIHHDAEKVPIKIEKDSRKKAEKEKDRKDEREHRDRNLGDRNTEQDREREIDSMQTSHRDKRRSAKKANELIRKQTQAGEGADAFNIQRSPNPYLEDKHFQKCVQFCDKVKARLRNNDTYQEFLKCLHIYSQEIINKPQLQSLISDILGKFKDLMDGFNELLTQCENFDDILADYFNKKTWTEGSSHAKSVKIESDREKERDRDKEEKEKDQDRDRDKERHDKSSNLYVGKEQMPHKVPSLPNKDKYMNKPISELDLSNCERCTPSYRLLPKNYPKPTASQRTELATSVLNDIWVSVTSGSEDYSFKHMRKNQYEESLFRCEDDRFELDMLLESTAVTMKRIEELLEKIKDSPVKQDTHFQIDDHLSAINLRCIERIYGDHGLDVIDLLRKNAVVSLPVILSRLKQKQEEWLKCRADMNKVWSEVYAKNYHKSLDHRSFYFKQQDKKSLSTKGLLTEIKEINEKKRKEDDLLLAIAAGNRRLIVPNLQFEYSDPDIHEDLYQIIKYSCDEVCSNMEQVEKVMRIWKTFVEPMLGVPTRPHGAEDTEEAVKAKNNVKTTLKNALESDSSTIADVRNAKQSFTCGNGESGLEASVTVRNRIANGESARKGDNCSQNGFAFEAERLQSTASVLVGHIGKLDDSNPLNAAVVDTSSGRLGSNSRSVTGLVARESCTQPVSKSWICPSQEVWGHPVFPEEGSRLKVEREEGELSPSPDIEDQLNGAPPANPEQENGSNRQFRNRHTRHDEADCTTAPAGEHEADADDEGEESPQRSLEDSENASEAGEEVSRSESRDGDECSQDHDEVEDDDEEHEDNDGKAESEGEVEVTADANDLGEGGTSSAVSDFCLVSVKPLAKHVPSSLNSGASKDTRIFYGNDSFYVLFRLHQTLYERILSAKKNSLSAEQKWKSLKDSNPPNLYSKFLSTLFSLLDGSSDNAKFEDDCRAIIGTQSYVLFTLDKLIFKLVKQLQSIASDDIENKLLLLHNYESLRAPERFLDIVYHANARVYLHDENIYRFECSSNPTCLSIQLMERGSEKLEGGAVAMEPSFANYLNNVYLSPVNATREANIVYLARNKRKYESNDEYTSTCKAMKGVQVVNGLEYKITCSTSKVSYVLDTEDFLFRRKGKKQKATEKGSSQNEKFPQKGIDKRVILFSKWIEDSDHIGKVQ